MIKVHTTLPNLAGGVSQQPYTLRLPSQCERSVNTFGSVIDGARERPPFRHVKKIYDGTLANVNSHFINRDETEQYHVLLTSTSILVSDLEGTIKTVSYPDGTGGLTCDNPQKDLALVTIGDYTFIVNKEKTVAMSSELSPARNPEALLFVRSTSYSCTYRVILNGSEVASYTTATTSATALEKTAIVDDLKTQIDANTSGYTVTASGAVLHIMHSTDFTCSVECSHGTSHFISFKDRAQYFSDLPVEGPDGFTVEIVGDDTTSFDNYYVKFVGDDSSVSISNGVWEETVAPNITYKLDPSTMPYSLIRQSDGTFSYEQNDWGARSVGDEDSNSNPSFVGKNIRDVYFFRNRMGFLSGENTIMSRASEFFEFFRSTITTKVDNDPIDKSASTNSVANLEHALPYNSEVLFFAPQGQFVSETGDTLSQDEFEIVKKDSYSTDVGVPPVEGSSTVFFPYTTQSFSGINEYYVDTESGQTMLTSTTDHVPSYIPRRLRCMSTSKTGDVLCVVHEDNPNEIYVYKYFWVGNQKKQSAWQKFKAPVDAEIINLHFVNSTCHCVVQYPDGIYLETMNFESGNVDPGSDFTYVIDRKVSEEDCTIVYDVDTDTSTVTFPYEFNDVPIIVTRFEDADETSSYDPGQILGVVSYSGTDVIVSGDLTECLFFGGHRFTTEYEFSTQIPRDRKGEKSADGGRTVIGQFTVSFDDTGPFKIRVVKNKRTETIKTFSGRVLGDASAEIGEVPMDTGTLTTAVRHKATRTRIILESDSILPRRFQSAEWYGSHNYEATISQ